MRKQQDDNNIATFDDRIAILSKIIVDKNTRTIDRIKAAAVLAKMTQRTVNIFLEI